MQTEVRDTEVKEWYTNEQNTQKISRDSKHLTEFQSNAG